MNKYQNGLLILVTLAVISLFSGCAAFLKGKAPTPYQPYQETFYHSIPDMKGRISGGYTDAHIKDNRYSVTFKGNGATDRTLVTKYAHQRALELCQQNGFKNYKVLNETQSSEWVTHVGVELPITSLDIVCIP